MRQGGRKAMIAAVCVFVLGAAAFLYTFFQPHLTATVVSLGRVTSAKGTSMKNNARGRTYPVQPLTVVFTDRDGTERTVRIDYARPPETLAPGGQIEIAWDLSRYIPYPWKGLRLFGGCLMLAAALFLGFSWLDRKPKTAEAGRKP